MTDIDAAIDDAHRIALAYAPRRLAAAYDALFRLDAQARRIAVQAREPALAQIRLAWWRDALATGQAGEGVHPVLALLTRLDDGERRALGALIDGWEEWVAGEAGARAAVRAVAAGRASALAAVAGGGEAVQQAAMHWTAMELLPHVENAETRAALMAEVAASPAPRLAPALRPLAVLDGLARRAAARGGGPLMGDRLSPLAAIRLGILGR